MNTEYQALHYVKWADVHWTHFRRWTVAKILFDCSLAVQTIVTKHWWEFAHSSWLADWFFVYVTLWPNLGRRRRFLYVKQMEPEKYSISRQLPSAFIFLSSMPEDWLERMLSLHFFQFREQILWVNYEIMWIENVCL